MLVVAAGGSLLGLVLGDGYVAELAMWLMAHVACLLLGFIIHESAHGLAGRQFSGVSAFVVSSNLFRFSLSPVGRLFGWQVLVISLAGPSASAAAGCLLFAAAPGLWLHWWFWLHLAFLAPLFGDGRSLIIGVRHWSTSLRLHGEALSHSA